MHAVLVNPAGSRGGEGGGRGAENLHFVGASPIFFISIFSIIYTKSQKKVVYLEHNTIFLYHFWYTYSWIVDLKTDAEIFEILIFRHIENMSIQCKCYTNSESRKIELQNEAISSKKIIT